MKAGSKHQEPTFVTQTTTWEWLSSDYEARVSCSLQLCMQMGGWLGICTRRSDQTCPLSTRLARLSHARLMQLSALLKDIVAEDLWFWSMRYTVLKSNNSWGIVRVHMHWASIWLCLSDQKHIWTVSSLPFRQLRYVSGCQTYFEEWDGWYCVEMALVLPSPSAFMASKDIWPILSSSHQDLKSLSDAN